MRKFFGIFIKAMREFDVDENPCAQFSQREREGIERDLTSINLFNLIEMVVRRIPLLIDFFIFCRITLIE